MHEVRENNHDFESQDAKFGQPDIKIKPFDMEDKNHADIIFDRYCEDKFESPKELDENWDNLRFSGGVLIENSKSMSLEKADELFDFLLVEKDNIIYESNINDEANNQCDNLYQENSDVFCDDNPEEDLEQIINEYFDDLREKSECPDTIPDKPFDVSDLEKLSPEENAQMRDEFDDKRVQLKKEWEAVNGRPWPKYDSDIYSANGKLIRKAGSDYDAHHIQPLGMGGKNIADNITPLNAEVHYDKQGVHSADSPYSKLDKTLGGMG